MRPRPQQAQDQRQVRPRPQQAQDRRQVRPRQWRQTRVQLLLRRPPLAGRAQRPPAPRQLGRRCLQDSRRPSRSLLPWTWRIWRALQGPPAERHASDPRGRPCAWPDLRGAPPCRRNGSSPRYPGRCRGQASRRWSSPFRAPIRRRGCSSARWLRRPVCCSGAARGILFVHGSIPDSTGIDGGPELTEPPSDAIAWRLGSPAAARQTARA